eukprot:1158342-Pelagomonas_calceolata.AAC.6
MAAAAMGVHRGRCPPRAAAAMGVCYCACSRCIAGAAHPWQQLQLGQGTSPDPVASLHHSRLYFSPPVWQGAPAASHTVSSTPVLLASGEAGCSYGVLQLATLFHPHPYCSPQVWQDAPAASHTVSSTPVLLASGVAGQGSYSLAPALLASGDAGCSC